MLQSVTETFIKSFPQSEARFKCECMSYDALKKLNLQSIKLPNRLSISHSEKKVTYEKLHGVTPLEDASLREEVITSLAELYKVRKDLYNELPFLQEKSVTDVWHNIKQHHNQPKIFSSLETPFIKTFELSIFTDAKPDHFLKLKNSMYRIDFDGFTTAHYLSDAAQFISYMFLHNAMTFQSSAEFIDRFLNKIDKEKPQNLMNIFWLLCWYSNIKKRPYIIKRTPDLSKQLDELSNLLLTKALKL